MEEITIILLLKRNVKIIIKRCHLPFKSEQLKNVAYFTQKERGKACPNKSINDVTVQLPEITVSLRGAMVDMQRRSNLFRLRASHYGGSAVARIAQAEKIASLPSVARNDTRRRLPRAELLLNDSLMNRSKPQG